MQPAAPRERVRCRLIAEGDLPAIADLLCAGFPGRTRSGWLAGLACMRSRPVPAGAPQFGYCLDAGGRLVGVILLIASERMVEGRAALFCNVASWYVMPDYRAYAQLIVSIALRNKEATYTNVSAAPHTWPIVENQGYTRYCGGLFMAAGLLAAPQPGVVIRRLPAHGTDPAIDNMPDCGLLRRHQEMGCESVVCQEGDRLSGYVFRRFRIRAGRLPLPAMFVIHGPHRDQLIRFAGNFSRHFLWQGAPFLVMDADGPVAGLKGFYTETRGRKYYRGPHRPALCDLADSEFAVFGL